MLVGLAASAVAPTATLTPPATPPAGWRSWNEYQGGITQQAMEANMRELARTRNLPDGTRSSLAHLGYKSAGLDDGWQRCGRYGPSAYRYHDAGGAPVVDTHKFPSLANMTKLGRSLGLTMGWYGNACGCVDGCCSDHCDSLECFAGDVNATVALGFTSYKIDGCGAQRDIELWHRMFNHTLRARELPPMVLENCHDGEGGGRGNVPYYDAHGELWCPFDTYRISADARPTYGSILSNLNASIALLDANLSVPGCWAYLDMLEVGVTNTQHVAGAQMNCGASGDEQCPPLSFIEAQSHFGAWAILSSPLVLGFNLSDSKAMATHLPTISNRDAIAINQDYAGSAGGRFWQSAQSDMVEFEACGWAASFPNRTNASCAWPRQMHLYKPLSARDVRRSTMAVLLLNNGNGTASSGFEWSAVPGLAHVPRIDQMGCVVYDVWRQVSLGRVVGPRFDSESPVPSRGSRFLTLSQCGQEPRVARPKA